MFINFSKRVHGGGDDDDDDDDDESYYNKSFRVFTWVLETDFVLPFAM